jgi:F-box-like
MASRMSSDESGSNLSSNPLPATQSGLGANQKEPQSQESQKNDTQRNLQTTLALTAKFTSLVIKDWVPHVLSPAQIQHYRLDTHRRIQKIRDLEAEQTQLIPKKSPRLEQALFMARLDYRVRFSRIFRINDMPPEVLTNIFRYVIWSAVSPDHGVRWRLWVTWVCRHWRETALSDPMLWNAIWFRDLPNFERSFAWLERSADAPLDIRINDTKENPIPLSAMHNLLQRLLGKISNIRIFIVVLQEWDPILVVLHAFRVVREENLPMILERFEMHRSGSPYVQIGAGYEPSFYRKPIPLFGGATVPSFNYLSLNGLHIDWANSVLTNLTTLDIRRIPLDKAPTLNQFRALLGGSPALRKLFLDGAGPGWSNVVSLRETKPVHIPSLRILILGDFSQSYALYVCSQIFVPNVLDLTLMNFVGEDYSKLYELLKSNMPLVKILTLYNIDFTPGPRSSISIIKWLESMPLITYFRIGNVKPQFLELFLYNYKTMRSLAEAQTSSPHIPCPKLAFLEFEAVQTNVIIRWAHIRKQLGSPLRKIYLSVTAANQVGAEQYQRLAAALDSGGTIQVLTPGCRPVEETNLSKEVNR